MAVAASTVQLFQNHDQEQAPPGAPVGAAWLPEFLDAYRADLAARGITAHDILQRRGVGGVGHYAPEVQEALLLPPALQYHGHAAGAAVAGLGNGAPCRVNMDTVLRFMRVLIHAATAGGDGGRRATTPGSCVFLPVSCTHTTRIGAHSHRLPNTAPTARVHFIYNAYYAIGVQGCPPVGLSERAAHNSHQVGSAHQMVRDPHPQLEPSRGP